MALQKSNLAIPFAVSVDTKTDPLQVMPTSLLSLVNGVFTKDKRVQKRNGFGTLTSLPSSVYPTTVTTFNNNLTVVGNSLQAYNSTSSTWINKGRFQPVSLTTKSLLRNSLGQTATDTAVAGTQALTVYLDGDGSWKYIVSDVNTTQLLVGPVLLPSGAANARVAVLGTYFIVTFLISISGTPNLEYIAVPLANLTAPLTAVSLSATIASTSTGYDIASDNVGGFFYYAYNGSDGAVHLGALSKFLVTQLETSQTGTVGNQISVALDTAATTTVVWVTFYTTSGTTLNAMAYTFTSTAAFTQVLAPTTLGSSGTRVEIASSAYNGLLTTYSQISNTYTYDSGVRTDYIQQITCTQSGTVGTPTIIVRGVGLASKVAVVNNIGYILVVSAGQYQPSYFLVDQTGALISKLAYSNASGYATTEVLPSTTVVGSVIYVGYLITELVQPVNKSQIANSNNAIYTQTGLNLASFDLSFKNLATAEIGGSLLLPGGFLWMYDGTTVCENNFMLWPENVEATWSATGGSMAALPNGGSLHTNQYFYQVTYEWTDAAGNIHRSAPSVPLGVTTSGSGTSGSVTLDIPTLRLTYKTGVRLVVYRWSTAQQEYYQVTSITSPLLNDPTVDYLTYTDTQADASIIGNLLIYTTGGVVEDIAAPPCESLVVYGSRLCLVNSEDRNQLWFSKQVIENTPVEMSDLFTIYVAPTTGLTNSSGATTALTVMDDKLIIGKASDLYYITGAGPDNTGANNDFSNATLITSVAGFESEISLVFSPVGILFKSTKGIWLLGRDLSTQYIGAPVEDFNQYAVQSSVLVPNTNQIRFTLSNNESIVYDYYFSRWGSFDSTDAISSTIYNDLHTFLSSRGTVFQETPGLYVDGSNPVLLSFTTAWMNLAGVQGFERAYMFYLLGSFLSAHQLSITIGYDYNASPTQQLTITPTQVQGTWGESSPYWGTDPSWGGSDSLEQWRIFLNRQKLQSFQITLQEVYNSSQGFAPGAGLTISGLNMVVGMKKGYVPLPNAQSAG